MSDVLQNKSHDEDAELIKEFLGNKEEAFTFLLKKYKDMIFNLCYRILGDYDDANDCAQETFIKVYNNLKKFRFRSGFSTWIYRIAVNTCRNELSSLKFRMKRKTLSINPGNTGENPGASGFYAENIKDNSSNPAELFEKKEREELIQNAVNSLKNKEKVLVVLRDIEGKSYEEISAITGIALGTVKSRLSRARQELGNLLRGVI